MTDYYSLRYDDVVSCLKEIFHNNARFCKFSVHYGMDPMTDDSETEIDVYHPVGSRLYRQISVWIGTKSLEEHMLSDTMVQDKDAVLSVLRAFHESAHIWQYSVGYMQKENSVSFDLKNMARDRVIGLCLPDYKNMSYVLDTSEIYANRYAVFKTKQFFQEKGMSDVRFSRIDVDDVLCDYFCRLYGPTWRSMEKCRNSYELVNGLDDAFIVAPYKKKLNMTYLLSLNDHDDRTKELLANHDLLNSISFVKSGIEESDLLCKYLGKRYPAEFRSVLCIRDQYCRDSIAAFIDKALDKPMKVYPQTWYRLYDKEDDGDDFYLDI